MKILFIFVFCFLSAFVLSSAKADYCYTVAQGNGADAANGTTNMNNYIVSETNTMAGTICRLLGLLQSDILRALLAFVLVIMGFGTYLGKVNLGLIVSFIIGVAGIFALPTLLKLISPYSNFGAGCNCNRYVIIGYNGEGAINPAVPLGYGSLPRNGTPGYIWQDIGLNADCTTINPVPTSC